MEWLDWFMGVIREVIDQVYDHYGFERREDLIDLQVKVCRLRLLAGMSIISNLDVSYTEEAGPYAAALYGKLRGRYGEEKPSVKMIIQDTQNLAIDETAKRVAAYASRAYESREVITL